MRQWRQRTIGLTARAFVAFGAAAYCALPAILGLNEDKGDSKPETKSYMAIFGRVDGILKSALSLSLAEALRGEHP